MNKHKIYKLSQNWYGACGMCSRVLVSGAQPQAAFALEDHVRREHMIWSTAPQLISTRATNVISSTAGDVREVHGSLPRRRSQVDLEVRRLQSTVDHRLHR